jgi:hypothetical protein
MTICAGLHAPDDGRDLLIPLGHYIARLATGRDFEVVYDRATDEPIAADVLARWNATDWEPETRPAPSRFRTRRCVRAIDLLDSIAPPVEAAIATVERRSQPLLLRYLRHRASYAAIDAISADLRDHDAAATRLRELSAQLSLGADALAALPLPASDPPTKEQFAALAEQGAPR